MTAHLHSTVVDGCYRCELGKDEVEASLDDLRYELSQAIYKAGAEKLYIIEAVLDL